MNGNLLLTLVLVFAFMTGTSAEVIEYGSAEYQALLMPDLTRREALRQTETPEREWYTEAMLQGWGPMPKIYPGVEKLVAGLPAGVDVVRWKRDRLVAIARHYVGLPYRHHHIPAWSPQTGSKLNLEPGPGLDCSNFTAWVYDFGFGIALNGDVVQQARLVPRKGYELPPEAHRVEIADGLQPADLLYIFNKEKTEIVHVVIYIDEGHIIDSTGTHVAVRNFSGWYRARLSHAIRIF